MKKKAVNQIRKTVNDMLAKAPKSAKKDGISVIEKNGKVYVYHYNKKKK